MLHKIYALQEPIGPQEDHINTRKGSLLSNHTQ